MKEAGDDGRKNISTQLQSKSRPVSQKMHRNDDKCQKRTTHTANPKHVYHKSFSVT